MKSIPATSSHEGTFGNLSSRVFVLINSIFTNNTNRHRDTTVLSQLLLFPALNTFQSNVCKSGLDVPNTSQENNPDHTYTRIFCMCACCADDADDIVGTKASYVELAARLFSASMCIVTVSIRCKHRGKWP